MRVVNIVSARWTRFVLVATSGAILAFILVAKYWEDLSKAPSGRRDGATFQILSGVGKQTPEGLIITEVGQNGLAIAATNVPQIDAEKYSVLLFDIEGLDGAKGSGVYFTRTKDPTVGHPRELSLDLVRQGRIRLSDDPRWTGEIETTGFIIQGPLKRQIVIRSVTFLSD